MNYFNQVWIISQSFLKYSIIFRRVRIDAVALNRPVQSSRNKICPKKDPILSFLYLRD